MTASYEELRQRQANRRGLIGGHWTDELREYKRALEEYAYWLRREQKVPTEEIAKRLAVHRSTAAKYIAHHKWCVSRGYRGEGK